MSHLAPGHPTLNAPPADTVSAAAAILTIWTDIPAEIEADFNDWYNREHLPDRIRRMPGFLRGRRYAAMAGAPKFLTLYDLESSAVMLSEAHVALRRQRTARDLLFVPRFQNTIKGICDVVCRVGEGEAGFLVAMPVIAQPGRETEFSHWVCDELLPELARLRGITSATYAVRNAAVTQASSAKDDRAGDRYLENIIVIEAASEQGVGTAMRSLDAANLASAGGGPHLLAAPCALRILYTLHAPARAGALP